MPDTGVWMGRDLRQSGIGNPIPTIAGASAAASPDAAQPYDPSMVMPAPAAEPAAPPPDNLAGTNPVLDNIARRKVEEVWARLKRQRGPFEPEWRDCSKAYDLLKVRQYYIGRSDLVLPTIANLVERIVPRVVRATVGRADFFECLPERSEEQDKSLLNQELVKSQLERADFRRKYPLLVRDAAIYGTGIWKQKWRKDVRADTKQTLFDGPDGGPIDIETVWVDPRSMDFNKTPVVERMVLNFTEIKKLEATGVFQNVGDALKHGPGSTNSNVSVDNMRRVRRHGYMEEGLQPGQWEYVEYWGEFAIDSTDEFSSDLTETVPCVIGILGGTHVVRLERNPYDCQRNPYFKLVLLERTGEFYGTSLVRKCLNLWIEQNDARNQANDARSFAVCPVMLKPPTGQADKKTSQRIFPGAVIAAPIGTTFASFPDVTTPVLRWEPISRRDMEETVGAPAMLDAQEQSGTATEAGIKQVESGVRIASYAYVAEDVFLIPLLSFTHDLNKQYLQETVAVRIKGFKGFDFRPVTAQDIVGNFTFKTVGASSMARGASLTAQFLQTTDRMLVVEQTQPGTFDMTRWWETYFRDALDIPHPDLYIKALKFQGRVPTVDEVHYMLSQGQRVEPDPRQDFATNLPLYGAYINQIKASVPADILKLFIAHLLDAEATAKEVLQAKLQMAAMQRAAMIAQQPPEKAAGSSGGKSNAPTAGMHRDGQGMSAARQHMDVASQGTAGRP